MPFYFVHSDARLDLEDMSLDRWVAIQEATGLKWHEVLTHDVIGDAKVARAVIEQASAHLGVPVPTPSLKGMVKLITFEAGENTPEQFNDGIPDPKAVDTEPVTI